MKHRAQVIEVYPDSGQCAVKFRYQNKDRIECVRVPDKVSVGDRGSVEYVMTPSMGLWSFQVTKKE